MPKFPMLDPAGEPDEVKPVFDQLRQTRGKVPGMYRVLAHQPSVLAAHRAYFNAALDRGSLPRAFKEKIAFKVARLRASAYCTGSHRRYALKEGVSMAELDAIERSTYDNFNAREQVALKFAERMIARRGDIGDEWRRMLCEQFSIAEAVEIVALIGIMDLACTLAETFGLDPD